MLKELIDFMARALVDNPEKVKVSEIEGEQTSVLELRVAKEDLGKVIGKQGRTARAMRMILSAASTKIRKRAVLEIIELGPIRRFSTSVRTRPSARKRRDRRSSPAENFVLDGAETDPPPQPTSLAVATRRLFSPMIRYRSCHSVGPLDGDTCTAVTLYSGQLVAQSELSVVTTFT